MREAIEAARQLGVRILTLYTFSTENWKRPEREVRSLFGLLEEYLDREEKNLNKNNIRLFVIGDIDGLPGPAGDRVKKVMESTSGNTGFTLSLALNYGGRNEIARAARHIAGDVMAGKLDPKDIDEKLFPEYLYTKGLRDPDLVIRTSGEYRVSNFLLWQIAYSELYVEKKFWPDFTKNDFKKAIMEYQKRERRFGG